MELKDLLNVVDEATELVIYNNDGLNRTLLARLPCGFNWKELLTFQVLYRNVKKMSAREHDSIVVELFDKDADAK